MKADIGWVHLLYMHVSNTIQKIQICSKPKETLNINLEKNEKNNHQYSVYTF